tara:strand:- start:89 stop:259 length:171 start_codon:yes stop_codon:yes gene_type:complete
MLKKIKGLTIRQPKLLSINTRAYLEPSSRKYPPDIVETFIEKKKKELMKKKGKKDA